MPSSSQHVGFRVDPEVAYARQARKANNEIIDYHKVHLTEALQNADEGTGAIAKLADNLVPMIESAMKERDTKIADREKAKESPPAKPKPKEKADEIRDAP